MGGVPHTLCMSGVHSSVSRLFIASNRPGATVVDNFTIVGNALGSRDWDGSTTWFTGFGQNSKEEQLECGARFKYDVNGYLASAGSKFKSVQVGRCQLALPSPVCQLPEVLQSSDGAIPKFLPEQASALISSSEKQRSVSDGQKHATVRQQ